MCPLKGKGVGVCKIKGASSYQNMCCKQSISFAITILTNDYSQNMSLLRKRKIGLIRFDNKDFGLS